MILNALSAIIGIGESAYTRPGEGGLPGFVLALQSIQAACQDAGIEPSSIDGFVSFGEERSDAERMAAALGVAELRFAAKPWGGGGGGTCAAIAQAVAAVAAGYATRVVVFRSINQTEEGRFGRGAGNSESRRSVAGYGTYASAALLPYGALSAMHFVALRVRRGMYEHSIEPRVLEAVALAAYHHAQFNERAIAYKSPLCAKKYRESRFIAEPLRLYDCCRETDGAAAVVVVSANEAIKLCANPALVISVAQGGSYRSTALAENSPDYGSAGFTSLGHRLFANAGMSSKDIDVLQIYDHFTGAVALTLLELELCSPDNINQVLTFDNLIAPSGSMPLNTSGGHLAEGYVMGMNHVVEGVRQIRGTSTCQVPGARTALVTGGAMVGLTSAMILGAAEVVS